MKAVRHLFNIFWLTGTVLFYGCQTPYQDGNDTTAGKTVTIEVKGLSCPFCLPGVENNLEAVQGVKDVDSGNWSTGRIQVEVNDGQSVSDEELRKAVKRAGFTPGEIQRSNAHDKRNVP